MLTSPFSPSECPSAESIASTVRLAIAEDLGSGDATASLLPEEQSFSGTIICREPGILCGVAWANEAFWQIDSGINVAWLKRDGDALKANEVLARMSGSARNVLTAERTALNFLQLLSGTASTTHSYVKAVEGTSTRILDTRKTIPGLRLAQKYAVRAGGGVNHRIGLYDAILIKENHISAAGGIAEAAGQARQLYPDLLLEIEVETLEQLGEAVNTGADRVLLDNFELSKLRTAVSQYGDKIDLEASGGITLDTIAEVAQTGVDYISVGALTKHVKAMDLSLRFSLT